MLLKTITAILIIDYCNRANAVDLSKCVKADLFKQLLGVIREVRTNKGKLKLDTGRQRYFDFSDAAYRRILKEFYAKLNPYQKQELNNAGIKTVSKYSWYSDSRAKFKVHALLDCWAPSTGKIGGKPCSIAYTQARLIENEWHCDLKLSGNVFIRFLRDYFFPNGQQSGCPDLPLIDARGRTIDKSTFVDMNLPRFIDALSSIADASGTKKTIKFKLTSNEILTITNDETAKGATRLVLGNKSDFRKYEIYFEDLTPQEIIYSLKSLPNVKKRQKYLDMRTDRLMKKNFYGENFTEEQVVS